MKTDSQSPHTIKTKPTATTTEGPTQTHASQTSSLNSIRKTPVPTDTATTAPIKFYRDAEFLNSPDARPLRIMSEYHGPESVLAKHDITDTIVFFGSARILSRRQCEQDLSRAKTGQGTITVKMAQQRLALSHYHEECRELAKRLTQWSCGLQSTGKRFVVCSGGGPGLMEAANQGAVEAGGDSLGLGISLPHEQTSNDYISKDLSFQFHYFFMRKYWFAYLAKAFIIMPGGFGTLDELLEILTLRQTGKMTKKVPILLYGQDFWNRVINFDALVDFGTISPEDVELFHIANSVDDAFNYITNALIEMGGLDHPGGGM
ncbi:MAG: TIGR00730 family Rossman fold protein [Kordiimonas sp.]|nr:TIGR00730 family Rossman fold protein [Kordiimonas sp.]|tara:strand:+ start:589 stop:1542 length:954 start_codon:yes stop_codon:yes gene_type:complete